MSTPTSLAADPPSGPDLPEPGHPWLRLLLVMTVPVLLLLAGISLSR